MEIWHVAYSCTIQRLPIVKQHNPHVDRWILGKGSLFVNTCVHTQVASCWLELEQHFLSLQMLSCVMSRKPTPRWCIYNLESTVCPGTSRARFSASVRQIDSHCAVEMKMWFIHANKIVSASRNCRFLANDYGVPPSIHSSNIRTMPFLSTDWCPVKNSGSCVPWPYSQADEIGPTMSEKWLSCKKKSRPNWNGLSQKWFGGGINRQSAVGVHPFIWILAQTANLALPEEAYIMWRGRNSSIEHCCLI